MLTTSAEPLRLLVCHAPQQHAIFRIMPEQVRAAAARAEPGLPHVEPVIRMIDAPDIAEMLETCTAMVGWQFPVDAVRGTRGKLRLVQVSGAGFEHVAPLDWLPPGVVFTTAGGIHGPKLQEWATMVLLMLHANIPHFATAQRAHAWSKRHSSRIGGKTALIYGAGALGQAIARAAARLELRTIGVRRSGSEIAAFDETTTVTGARRHLAEADFVIFAMPLTPETAGIGNAEFFAAMKPGAGFANFGRGGLVVQDALAAALETEQLGGAILDVATPEPLAESSPLWDVPRLMITPHVSCDDPVTYVPDVLDVLFDNLGRLAQQRPLRNVVSTDC